MPLIPTATPAVADRDRRSVTFVMKDGSRPISIFVSNPALENIELSPSAEDGYFCTFKLYRKSFEKIASHKYDMGYLEPDGSVCIRAMDVPLASIN
jgi:hypothetical protein